MGSEDAPKLYGEAPRGSQGTPDEVKKGEEMMNAEERKLSDRREEIYKRFQEAGITGVIRRSGDREVSGEINGRTVRFGFELERDKVAGGDYYDVKRFFGSVDGQKLTAKDAAKAWQKFTGERVTMELDNEKTGGFVDDITEKDIKGAIEMATREARIHARNIETQKSLEALRSIGL